MMQAGAFLLFFAATAAAVGVPPILTPFKEYKVSRCPVGFERHLHECLRPETIPAEEVCPHGAIENPRGCFFAEEPTLTCPEGRPAAERSCEVVASAPSEWRCPEGTTQEGDKCYIGTALEICPVGTARTQNGLCGKLIEKSLKCPPGTTPAGDLCANTEVAPPEAVCPEGTVLVGDRCVAEAKRFEVCPKGASDEGENCAYFHPVEYECEPGFKPQDGTCVHERTAALAPSCPAGGELVNGMCKMERDVPLVRYCPKGDLVGEECHIKIDFPVSYQCPEGFSLEDGKKGLKCVSTVTYDCSVTKYECDPAKSKDLHVSAYKKDPAELVHDHIPAIPTLRKLEGKTAELLKAGGYYPSVHELHEFCYKVPVVVPKTCEKVTTAEPIPFCPDGIYDGKHSCVVEITEPAQHKCEATVNPVGECVLEESYHAVYECPEGFDQVHKECLEVVFGPVRYFCPEGTVEFQGQCATFVEKTCPKGGCDIEVSVAPEIVCPVEFVLEVDLHGREECVKTIYVFKVVAECPAGTQEVSPTTCGKLVPAVVIDDKSYIAPQVLCPIGFFPKHGECLSITYRVADQVCPVDFTLEDHICMKPAPFVDECPKGSYEKQGVCYVDVKARPLNVDSPVMKSPKEIPEFPEIPKIPVPELPSVTIPKPTIRIPKPTLPAVPKPTLPSMPKAQILSSSVSKFIPFM